MLSGVEQGIISEDGRSLAMSIITVSVNFVETTARRRDNLDMKLRRPGHTPVPSVRGASSSALAAMANTLTPGLSDPSSVLPFNTFSGDIDLVGPGKDDLGRSIPDIIAVSTRRRAHDVMTGKNGAGMRRGGRAWGRVGPARSVEGQQLHHEEKT